MVFREPRCELMTLILGKGKAEEGEAAQETEGWGQSLKAAPFLGPTHGSGEEVGKAASPGFGRGLITSPSSLFWLTRLLRA